MNIFIFVLLLSASAFFSGSETAFLSLDKIRLERIESMDNPTAGRVVKLLADPHKLLLTILIGNTLVNIAASAVLADFFYSTMGEKGIGVSIIAMTILVLIFGEVTPKRFALMNGQRFSFFSSRFIKVLEWLFTPVRLVLAGISYSIVRGLGFKVSSEKPVITQQEIRSLFSHGRKHGVVKGKEKEMIDGILEFKELNAADIMTPRIDIEAVDLTRPYRDYKRK